MSELTSRSPAALRSRTIARPRRSLIVTAGSGRTMDSFALSLARSLGELGIETTYLGREDCAPRIAAAVAEQRVDAVELCLGEIPGAPLLRELLRELCEVGRRDVSIVVHKER